MVNTLLTVILWMVAIAFGIGIIMAAIMLLYVLKNFHDYND